MSALGVVQSVASIIGLSSPPTLENSVDPIAKLGLSLLNIGGRQISRRRGPFGDSWQMLTREHSFSTVAGQADYDLPSDYVNLVTDSAWDRTIYYPMHGPISPQKWQQYKADLYLSPSFTPAYRIRSIGGSLKMSLDPVPSGVELLAFEYLSSRWVIPSGSDEPVRDLAVHDTDTFAFGDLLMEMYLLWRLKSARGLPYAEDKLEYVEQLDRQFSQEVSLRMVDVISSGDTGYELGIPTVSIHTGTDIPGTPSVVTDTRMIVFFSASGGTPSAIPNGALSSSRAGTVTLGSYSGNGYLFICQPVDNPDLESLSIGGFPLLSAFYKSGTTFQDSSGTMEYWRSEDQLFGSAISRKTMVVAR